jgi:hypothetical protein
MLVVPDVGLVTMVANVLPFKSYCCMPVPGMPITALFFDVDVPVMVPVVEKPTLSLEAPNHMLQMSDDTAKAPLLLKCSRQEAPSDSPTQTIDSSCKIKRRTAPGPVQDEARVQFNGTLETCRVM